MEDWSKEEQKALIKEAFKEWLDDKASDFGKWTLKWIGSAVFGYLLYWLATHGFLK